MKCFKNPHLYHTTISFRGDVITCYQLKYCMFIQHIYFSCFVDSDGLPQRSLYWINSSLGELYTQSCTVAANKPIPFQQPPWSSSAWVKVPEYFTSHSILMNKQESKAIKVRHISKYAIYFKPMHTSAEFYCYQQE